MVNITIYEGLRAALTKGESLRYAMNTFYNAGYSKAEIEEAAEALSSSGPIQRTPAPAPKPVVQKPKAPQNVSGYGQPQRPPILRLPMRPQIQPRRPIPPAPPIQKVSAYGAPAPAPIQIIPQDPRTILTRKMIIVILVTVLFTLLGLLAFLFIFKETVLTFFDKINIF